MSARLFSLALFVLMGTLLHAQTVEITGSLANTEGNPISGVSAIIPETGTGSISDAEGNFSILASASDTLLEFSDLDLVRSSYDDQWIDFNNYPVPTFTVVKFLAGDTWAADYVMMRASEMFLIVAEAAAEAGDDQTARDALNELIKDRDPGRSTSSSGQALIDEIRLQSRIELWGEGVGLFDIKRWKIPLDRRDHNPILCKVPYLPANSFMFNLKIPQSEIDANDDMVSKDDQIP